MSHVSPFLAWVALSLWLCLLFIAHVVLLIALPLMSCLSLLLKLGRTLRGKVSHIFTCIALDVSQISLLLIFAHHLGILIRSWMPCSCFTTSSCLLVFFFFIPKSPSWWLILTWTWGFAFGSSWGFLVGQDLARWPISWHLKHTKWESFFSSCFFISLLFLLLPHLLPLTLLLLKPMPLLSP